MIGQASASGRLDPPLLMALDECTQICRCPVDSWLADSGGKGLLARNGEKDTFSRDAESSERSTGLPRAPLRRLRVAAKQITAA